MTDATRPTPVEPSVGIDVAKDRLDLADTTSDAVLTLDNTPDGVRRAVEHLRGVNPRVVVLEATGGLEQPLLDALLDAGLPVARANPAVVRHFAKGVGVKAKTDRIDARVLARYAGLAAPRLETRRRKDQAELDALVTCRRQLTHVRTEQANRRGRTSSTAALRAIDAVLEAVETQVRALDRQIRELVDADDDFRSVDERLRSVPGVGAVLSATLLAELDELGKTDRRRIGALVGVAPFNHDSGGTRGKRSVRGGRRAVRGALYMATLAAMRCNPVIKRFGDRLKRAGKQNKVAITACMRKLLSLLNAMIRDNLSWDELSQVKALEN